MSIGNILKTLTAFFTSLIVVLLCQPFPALAKGDSVFTPVAESGKIDLSKWNFARDGIVALDGEWSFFWRALLEPGKGQTSGSAKEHYVSVPGSWRSYEIDNNRLSHQGYATYQLVIRLNESEIGKRFSLWIPSAASAYRIWIDETAVGGNGVVATQRSEMVAKDYDKTYVFTPAKTETKVTIQVSNFVQRKAGLWKSPKLGYTDDVNRAQVREIVVQSGLAGIFLIMGFYNLLLFYLLRPECREALYFGVVCIAVGLRVLVTGQTLLVQLFPDFSWELAVKIEYWGFILASTFFLHYIHTLYPDETDKRIVRAATVSAFVMCLTVLLFPAAVYTELLLLFSMIAVANILYVGFVVVVAAYRKRKDVWLHIPGWAFCIVAGVNDSIYYNWAISNADLVPFAILTAVAIQVIFLSLRYARAYKHIKRLSGELSLLNDSLEQKIRERTAELEKANEELRDAWHQVSQIERSRRRLMWNISHEIGTPLSIVQGYLKGMLDGVIPPGDRKRLIMIYEKTRMLARLIRDLGELSKLEARQVSFEMKPLRIREFVAQVVESMRMDFEQVGLTVKVVPDGPTPAADVYVLADAMRLEQVVINLLVNARKHTPPGGYVQMQVEKGAVQGQQMVTVSVSDNGEGIPADALPFVFDRFYQADQKGGTGKGMGLGLAICKEIIEIHGGSISVVSQVGKGSTFTFSLPIEEHRNEKEESKP